MNNKEPLKIGNYCVSFIDLLGQRLEYEKEGLLPEFQTTEEQEQFKRKLEKTVWRIYALQRKSDTFLNGVKDPDSALREQLHKNQQSIYDELTLVNLKQQRWSDGLVYFVSLKAGNVKCPMRGVHTLFLATGLLCFLGLADKTPLRGSIDIAWAAEMHEGELYGAAVAKAYELESYVAQYPRIVVGQRAVDYLSLNMNNPASDVYSHHNQKLARECYDMLSQDSDGYHFVHYLGHVFRKIATKTQHRQLHQNAMKFVLEEGKRWRDERNTKLSLRYSHLLSYFLANPPPDCERS